MLRPRRLFTHWGHLASLLCILHSFPCHQDCAGKHCGNLLWLTAQAGPASAAAQRPGQPRSGTPGLATNPLCRGWRRGAVDAPGALGASLRFALFQQYMPHKKTQTQKYEWRRAGRAGPGSPDLRCPPSASLGGTWPPPRRRHAAAGVACHARN